MNYKIIFNKVIDYVYKKLFFKRFANKKLDEIGIKNFEQSLGEQGFVLFKNDGRIKKYMRCGDKSSSITVISPD